MLGQFFFSAETLATHLCGGIFNSLRIFWGWFFSSHGVALITWFKPTHNSIFFFQSLPNQHTLSLIFWPWNFSLNCNETLELHNCIFMWRWHCYVRRSFERRSVNDWSWKTLFLTNFLFNLKFSVYKMFKIIF